jgi:HEAT repeat protein
LLVLVCIWAFCQFVVIDLFLNVSEFDNIRPRAQLYRAMRYAGHEMVGEPYLDGDFYTPRESRPLLKHTDRAARTEPGVRLAGELAAVRALEEQGAQAELSERAANAQDPRVRIVALRALAKRFGPEARDTLLAVVRIGEGIYRVRAQAARFVGLTGRDAQRDLDEILSSELPAAVRAGAVLGLGELGTRSGAERVLSYAAGSPSALRAAAVRALARMSSAEAAPVLRMAVRDAERKADTRSAACRALALGKDPGSVAVLSDVLSDASNSVALRAVAADSLGRLGQRNGLPVVAAFCGDQDPEVARQARIAKTRLEHIRVQ